MKNLLLPVALILLAGCSREIVPYHGHNYKTIKTDDQMWMAENLKTDRYRWGRKIPLVNDVSVWPELSGAACGYYDTDTARLSKYGMFYNWKAVDGGKLCPVGWRVPTNNDWLRLEEHLGGELRAGGRMKSVTGWKGKHVSGDDIGFNALPGGFRLNVDMQESESVVWWSSTIAKMNALENALSGESGPVTSGSKKWIWGRRLEMNSPELMNTVNRPNNGFYVRCVRKKLPR